MRLGPFEVRAELGRGGMGAVYQARDARTGVDVALKVMLTDGAQDPRFRQRFEREALALGQLHHPGIVAVRDHGVVGATAYLAMDLVAGGSLEARLKTGGPLAGPEVAALGRRLADALAFAHARGVVHRDLKPQNILFGADGAPVIADFGLVRLVGDEAGRLTRTGELLGTPGYMAPEQADGDPRTIGPATDVYALGATLYAALCGRPPHVGTTTQVLVALTRDEPPPPPSAHGVAVDAALEELVLRCLAKEPARRPASMAEVDQALARWEALRSSAAPGGRRGRRRGRRPAWTWLAAGGLLLLAVAGGALVVARRRRTEPVAPAPAAPTAPTEPRARPPSPRDDAALAPAARAAAADRERAAQRARLEAIAALPTPTPVAEVDEELRRLTKDIADGAPEAQFNALRTRAHLHLSTGDLISAVADCEELDRRFARGATQPIRDAIDYKHGYCLLCAGRVDEGLELLGRVLRTNDHPSTLEGLALGHWLKGDLASMAARADGIERQDPRRPTASLWRARVATGRGRDEEALEHLARALALSEAGGRVELLRERGRALTRLGRLDEARQAYREVQDTGGIGGAAVLRLLGEPERARALVEPVRRRYPRSASGHFMVGLLDDDAGAARPALEAMEEAVVLDPSHPDARGLQALLRLEAGDARGALASCDRALADFDPQAPQVLAARALALLALGDRALAEEDVALARSRDARCAEALLAAGRVRLAAGALEEGRARLEEGRGATLPGTGLRRRLEAALAAGP